MRLGPLPLPPLPRPSSRSRTDKNQCLRVWSGCGGGGGGSQASQGLYFEGFERPPSKKAFPGPVFDAGCSCGRTNAQTFAQNACAAFAKMALNILFGSKHLHNVCRKRLKVFCSKRPSSFCPKRLNSFSLKRPYRFGPKRLNSFFPKHQCIFCPKPWNACTTFVPNRRTALARNIRAVFAPNG